MLPLFCLYAGCGNIIVNKKDVVFVLWEFSVQVEIHSNDQEITIQHYKYSRRGTLCSC